MHITEKISKQMMEPFISYQCSDIREIKLSYTNIHKNLNIQITFVYGYTQELLTLLFINVHSFELEKDDAGIFSLGELLFYDDENGSPLSIGDESGGFSIVCEDVNFIKIEDSHEE